MFQQVPVTVEKVVNNEINKFVEVRTFVEKPVIVPEIREKVVEVMVEKVQPVQVEI